MQEIRPDMVHTTSCGIIISIKRTASSELCLACFAVEKMTNLRFD